MDDQELADELAELEQDELNKRLAGAESAPLHLPSSAVPNGKPAMICTPPIIHWLVPLLARTPAQAIEEDEEEAELRELQAQLAM